MHGGNPYSMMEPIRDMLYSTMQSDQLSTDKRWITTLRQQLHGAEVELTAELTYAALTLGQIQKMKVGDVIQVRVLGVWGMLDDEETDWKVLCINVNDPLAEKLNSKKDIDKHLPGVADYTFHFLKHFGFFQNSTQKIFIY